MPSAIATRPDTHIRYVPVEVPAGATKQEEDALVVQALLEAAARINGAPLPIRVEPVAPRRYAAGPPSPESCITVGHFLNRMRDLKRWSGRSYQQLEERAATCGYKLPRSTIARILATDNMTRMPTKDQMTAFVLACGLSEQQWREWAAAWADVQSTSGAANRWWTESVRAAADADIVPAIAETITHDMMFGPATKILGSQLAEYADRMHPRLVLKVWPDKRHH